MRDSTVPFERILAPIPPGTRKENDYAPDGSGRDYAYDYLDIEEARRVVAVDRLRGDETDAIRQKAQPQAKAADWDRVFALGVNVLVTESKDLRVAAWVVEALGHLRGFAGLRDGFTLFRRLQSRYQAAAYPRAADDDPEVRRGPYEFLEGDRILPLLIHRLPLTFPEAGAPLSYLECKEAERNEAASRGDDRAGEDGNGGAEDRLTRKDWESAVELTPPAALHRLASDVAACLIAFRAWERSTDRLWRGSRFAPSLSRIGEALLDCAREVANLPVDLDRPEARALVLAIQRVTSGRPLTDAPPPAHFDEPSPWDIPLIADPEPRFERRADLDPGPESEPESEPEREPGPVPRSTPTTAGGAVVGPPASVATAYRQVVEAAAFLRRENPGDPVPYLLIRSLRLGELFGREADLSVEPPTGPSSATRKDLRRAASAGDWDEVVELTEEILARPEGQGWLDAHRLAIRGLEESDRAQAARACRGLLAAALDHAPGLADAELDDGTAAASGETRAWLADLLPRTRNRDRPAPPQSTDEAPPNQTAEPDDDPTAESLLRDGQTDEAIAAFARGLDLASGDRARFVATVQFAEVCVAEGREGLAISLLEGLIEASAESSLRAWEGRSFFARGAGLLREALDRADGEVSTDRLARAQARLVALAPAAGLRAASRDRSD